MITLKPTGHVHDPIVIDRGDDFTIEVDCNDADGGALDLTGAMIEWVLAGYDSDVPLLTLQLGEGISLLPAADGATFPSQCLVSLPHDWTTTLAPGFYRDQLRVVTATGLVVTQSRGRIQVADTI